MNAFNSTEYKNKYLKENYDRLNITVPKGQKQIIEAHWRAKGYKSLNVYINELIRRDMEEEKSSKTVNIGHDNNGIINM